MDLTLERWDRLSPPEREALAKRVGNMLPGGFTFEAIRPFSLGDQRHEVAMFHFDGAAFALIPGGERRLGLDADRGWKPTPEERESWEQTAEEYGFDLPLAERVAEVTRRPRIVEIRPFLLETGAAEVGWEPVPLDDPEVREILREHGSNATGVEVSRGGVSTRVRRGEDGAVTAERSTDATHEELGRRLSEEGFRFPTSDEWEYACGGGGDTLFRWGDHVPCDRYPTDVSPEEAAWRRQWVLSAGRLEYPEGGFTSDWDFHRRPNAFGLSIASNPYHSELVAEPGISRGGDGGCMICGGVGYFVAWLTLATAYFEGDACKYDPDQALTPGYTIARRALPLPL